jgi:hypothetical protein
MQTSSDMRQALPMVLGGAAAPAARTAGNVPVTLVG